MEDVPKASAHGGHLYERSEFIGLPEVVSAKQIAAGHPVDPRPKTLPPELSAPDVIGYFGPTQRRLKIFV